MKYVLIEFDADDREVRRTTHATLAEAQSEADGAARGEPLWHREEAEHLPGDIHQVVHRRTGHRFRIEPLS